MAMVVSALGYQSVHLAGRRDFRGRNGRDGRAGYDLTATQAGRQVVIQLKQFPADRRLFQRSLDELRGVTLRSGAAEALLITTGMVSPSVDREAHRLAPITPISLIDGKELLELLLQHRIGVTHSGKIDDAFFRQLVETAQGNGPGPGNAAHTASSTSPEKGTLEITVGVRCVSRTTETC
jgi:restriction endonuclease Mrr